MNDDLISRAEAIEAFKGLLDSMLETDTIGFYEIENVLFEVPSAQPDGWLEQNKDKILQAGMEGREIDFRIGGRLFAIREKAQ